MKIPSVTLSPSLLQTLHPAAALNHTLSTSNKRLSNRLPNEPRPFQITTPNLTHCAGASLVTIGRTIVLVGIQAETIIASQIPDPPRARLTPPANAHERRQREEEDIAGLALLPLNVELGTGALPSHLPDGSPPSQWSQSLSFRLRRVLSAAHLVPLEDLTIRRDGSVGSQEEVAGYWVLYISVTPLSVDGKRSLFDAMLAGVVHALQNVKLPRAWWDIDKEVILCSGKMEERRNLRLRGLPVACTFGVFTAGTNVPPVLDDGYRKRSTGTSTQQEQDMKRVLMDPDGSEDDVLEDTVTVVLGNDKVVTIEKGGGVNLTLEEVSECVNLTVRRFKHWNQSLPEG